MDKFKLVLKKYQDVIPYLFFGVCTTIVNVFAYWMCSHLFLISTMISSIVAWIAAVLFAYLTNRKWVFNSNANTINDVIKEITSFFCCRFATGVVDWMCMYVFVEILNMNDLVIKVFANVLVIVLNYVASKLIIFKEEVS